MSPKICLNFTPQGVVESLNFAGVEFIASNPAQNDLFQINLRDFVGNPMLLDSNDFCNVDTKEESGSFTIRFSDCKRFPGTTAKVSALVINNEICWRIEFTPGSEDFAVEWIDFPRVRLRRFNDGKYLLPFAEGTLISDLNAREAQASFHCRIAEYPMTGVSSFYPGPAAMQFEAFYTHDAGICFLCRDVEHSPKSIDFMPDGEAVRPVLQHFTGGKNMVDYEVATIGFHGNWQSAAELYRYWMEENDPFLPAKLESRMPGWLADSPVILIYPVRGSGLDHGGLNNNEYYPYIAALPVAERYQKAWDCRVMALLMHWEGTAPWAPPYVWPPYGGEELLAEFITAMHNKGNLVGLYGSGIGWTQKSMIDPAYECTAEFAEKHLEREVCTGPHGEAFSRVCNGLDGQRIGYDLCPAREFTKSVVTQEIASASRLDIDYLQYFDQNQGCAAPLCYAKDHGHVSLPGAWHTAAMRSLLADAERAAGDTVLGCENAAAEPYLGVCQLNDLRSHLAWGTGGVPVPLYSYLFHEYSAGFSGNGVCLNAWIDLEKTPFFMQWTIGWNFAFGNLLSVVLKDHGKIHWNWNLAWDQPAPEQESTIRLIGNLTKLRRGAASEYLVAGRMEKAPAVACAIKTVYLKQTQPAEYPAVIASAWSHAGKRAYLLVNYTENPESCRVDFKTERSGKIVSIEGATPFAAENLFVTVPPLNAVLIEFEN